MGSSPILAETPPLGSSVGRARTQRQMHLVLYCAGGAKVAHLAHYQKTTFESFARNQRILALPAASERQVSVGVSVNN